MFGAAVFLGHGDAQHAELAHLAPQVHRELVAAVDLGGARRDLGLREGAHRVAQRVDVFAELEVRGRAGSWCVSCVVQCLDVVAADDGHHVAVMVATSFSRPSSIAQARPSTTLMVRPGLTTGLRCGSAGPWPAPAG